MIHKIDCSIGEGGGSIIRIALALATTTKTPIRLENIRSNRPNPGLQAQHVEAVRAIQQLSGMKIKGCMIGSSTIEVSPGKAECDIANVNIKTAGSIPLVAQAVLYYAFSQTRTMKLVINGGATHGKWAPSVEYIESVIYPLLNNMNKQITLKIGKYGFYPKGGAKCEFSFHKHTSLEPLLLNDKGDLIRVEIYSIASSILRQRKVAERQLNSFLSAINVDIDIIPKIKYVNSLSPGTGLTVISQYSNGGITGCFVTGERKLTSEQVGKLCAHKWKKNYEGNSTVDEYAADQLIVPMALTEGNSSILAGKITNHTKTNIALIHKLTKSKIEIVKERESYLINVQN